MIATHDDLVREIADEISFIRQGHLVHEQVRGYSEEQACLQTPFSERAISPVFYRICARRTRGVREMAAIALMVLIMTMLSVIGPLLRSMNIDERHAQLQEELYLILCNTKEPIPDVTFVNNAALFSDAQIQLLEHIEGAGEVSAYWECSVVGHDDLIVIPDRHIRDIEIPAVLEGEQEMTIQMEMAGQYILSVVDLSMPGSFRGRRSRSLRMNWLLCLPSRAFPAVRR